MNASRVCVIACALVQAALYPSAARAANDYPTLDRVVFVEKCIRDHPDRPRQEMIYKCSCALDAIASQMTLDEFVEGETAVDAGQIAGERGNTIRESRSGQTAAKRFREVRSKAFNGCFIQ
jgi:hypothetical protein